MASRYEAGLNLERTIFFSDAVIAIAMTLLAIELPLPRGETGTQVWHSFVDHLEGPYLAFVISFLVIAGFWYRHHRFFEHVDRVSIGLTVWNLASLFTIVLIPFATQLLSAPEVGVAPGERGNYALGAIFYAAVMLSWGISYVGMVMAARRQGLWRPGTPATLPGDMIFGACAALAMFAVSIPIAFVNSSAAMYSWLLIPVVANAAKRVRELLAART